MKTEAAREAVKDFLGRVPFQPFLLHFESGEKVVVEYPENITFNPEADPASRAGRLLLNINLYDV